MTDTNDITNAERADRCHAALEHYNDKWDVNANLIDFLADARHWCDRNGLCYGDLDKLAHRHYLHELEDERRPL